MKRTSAISLIVLGVTGAAAAGFLQMALASAGRPVLQLPVTLPLALVAIGAIVIALAVPIRRMTRGSTSGPVDPFYATRVVMLAKASSLSGSLLTGAAIGMVAYLFTRAVTPGASSAIPAIAGLVGAAVLVTCGLVAEAMCRIPPNDDDAEDDDDKPLRVSA